MILNLDAIISLFFQDDSRTLSLKEGEVLFEEGEANDRLYYVRKGSLSALAESNEQHHGFLVVSQGDFAGIQSFLDDTKAKLSLVADEDSKVSYITKRYIEDETFYSLEKVIAPIFLHVADRRQKRIYEIMLEQEKTRIEAATQNKLDALGQFSAGVAHELNNAVAVIEQSSRWLPDVLGTFVMEKSPELNPFFQRGLTSHRVSSHDQREHAKQLSKRFGLSPNLSRKCAQAHMTETEIKRVLEKGKDQGQEQLIAMHKAYEMGTVMFNLGVSGEQAASVVDSMRNLGNTTSSEGTEVSLKETIDRTLSILRNVTKGIQVDIHNNCEDLILLGNKGELIQVWTNITRNCCEALRQGHTHDPKVMIEVDREELGVSVVIGDNGPGIPQHALRKIFQPNYTTKKTGLQFGLGIGLSIVMRIIHSYGGEIKAYNASEGGARFSIYLPLDFEQEKT